VNDTNSDEFKITHSSECIEESHYILESTILKNLQILLMRQTKFHFFKLNQKKVKKGSMQQLENKLMQN
jgi:hypothetical protein